MNVVPLPGRMEAADREAPSAIVSSSQTLVRWQFGLGIFAVTLTAILPWFVLMHLQYIQLMDFATRGRSILTDNGILIATGVLALLPAANAVCLFLSGAALRTFAQSRRVGDLHRAMRRLRTVWRTLSLTGFLITAAIIALTVLKVMSTRS